MIVYLEQFLQKFIAIPVIVLAVLLFLLFSHQAKAACPSDRPCPINGVCVVCLNTASTSSVTSVSAYWDYTIPWGAGGSGCSGCMLLPDAFEQALSQLSETSELKQGDTFGIGGQNFAPGEDVYTGLFRYYPSIGKIEPILEVGTQADSEGAVHFTVSKIPDNAPGGELLTISCTLGNCDFESIVNHLDSPDIKIQRFALPSLVTLNPKANLLDGRHELDIGITAPFVLNPNDIQIKWKIGDEELAMNTWGAPVGFVDPTVKKLTLYSPSKYFLESYITPRAPYYNLLKESPLLKTAYFPTGEYTVEIYVNGVLESTQTVNAIEK